MSDIWRMSATQIASAVRGRDLTALEVTEAHLARIGAVNAELNAVVQEFPEEALAAARAMMDSDKTPEAIARDAMAIAADICVYTNGNLTVETIG